MKNAVEKLDGADLHGRRIRLVEDKTRSKRGKGYVSSCCDGV